MLRIEELNVRYGDVQVLHSVTLGVREREIVTIVGGNGAGKSTLLKTTAGILRPSAGTIWFDGEQIDHLPSHSIVDRGLVRIPEGRRIFSHITVLENLQMGAYLLNDKKVVRTNLEVVSKLFPI